jgi:hypothetical protein
MTRYVVDGLTPLGRKQFECEARNEIHAASKAQRRRFWWIISVVAA